MLWLRNNIVGLLMAVLVMASSFISLYSKADMNERAIILQGNGLAYAVTDIKRMNSELHNYAIRTTQLEGQVSTFTQTNIRLVMVLDKLDVLYGSLKVTDAVVDERIKQLIHKIDKLEKDRESKK